MKTQVHPPTTLRSEIPEAWFVDLYWREIGLFKDEVYSNGISVVRYVTAPSAEDAAYAMAREFADPNKSFNVRAQVRRFPLEKIIEIKAKWSK